MTQQNHTQLKSALRREVRRRLALISGDALGEASARACAHLLGLDAVQRAEVLMLYLPLAGEVDVTSAIEHLLVSGKQVCVPRVNWEKRDMLPVSLTNLADAAMQLSRHGLREPRDAVAVDAASVDVVVVPGLAFDESGHRLGRGGGFYDRFLARMHEGAGKIAVAFEAQMVHEVPMAVTDVAVDVVVTDQRVVHVSG